MGSLADPVRPTQRPERDGCAECTLDPLGVGGSSGSSGRQEEATGEPAPQPEAAAEGPEAAAREGGAAEEEAEEAVAVRPARTPCSPTRAEREDHESTHLPFRSWCSHCVAGRSGTPAHRLVDDPDGERRGLPEVHLDYAFLRRDGSDEMLKLLIVNFVPATRCEPTLYRSRGWETPRSSSACTGGWWRPVSGRRALSRVTAKPRFGHSVRSC